MNLGIEQFCPIVKCPWHYKSKCFEEAWNWCEDGSWMLWAARKLNIDEQLSARVEAMCKRVPPISLTGRYNNSLETSFICRRELTGAVFDKVRELEPQGLRIKQTENL
jgi:hypothetical protein